MIDTAHHALDGTAYMVTSDVHDICRRINDGDPTIGWPGDRSMAVCVDPTTGMFEVWGVDAAGNEYLALESPSFDQRVLERLRDGHWANGSAHDRVVARNLKTREDKAKVARDRREELADKLQFALRKDIGAYVGGLSRRLY